MSKASIEDTKKLVRLSQDCSYLLTHLIRKNDEKISSDEDASAALQSILGINDADSNSKLIGSVIGWYGSCGGAKLYQPYTDNHFQEPTEVKGVCFTDSTLAGLRAHRKVFKAKHGVAFDREFLFKRGANPCLNIRESLLYQEVKRAGRGHYKNVYNLFPTS